MRTQLCALSLPLVFGVAVGLGFTAIYLSSSGDAWMKPVGLALEEEELNSLERRAVAQSRFAENFFSKLADEVFVFQSVANKILSGEKNTTAAQHGPYYALPFGNTPNLLQYDNNVPVDSRSACSSQKQTYCYTNPGILEPIRTANEVGSFVASGVDWPRPSQKLSPKTDHAGSNGKAATWRTSAMGNPLMP